MSLLHSKFPKRRRREIREEEEARGWSRLPLDVISLVAAKASTPGDHVRFSAACRSFAQLAASLPLDPIRWDAPSPAHFYADYNQMRALLPLHLPRSPPPPLVRLDAPRCVMVGCSRGLLLLLDHRYRFSLLDPRTGASTPLPRPDAPAGLRALVARCESKRRYLYLQQVVAENTPQSLSLSSSDPADCVALCWQPRASALICWTSGDDHWTPLPSKEALLHVFHRGRFYLVSSSTFEASVCNIGAAEARNIPISRKSLELVGRTVWRSAVIRLVECRGDLLLAVGDHAVEALNETVCEYSLFRWKIFRLDVREEEGEGEWVEVRDLGSHSLFVGDNESFSLSARDFPGIEPNCVYISNLSRWRQRVDYVVYNIGSRATRVVYFGGVKTPGRPEFSWVRQFWIAPRNLP